MRKNLLLAAGTALLSSALLLSGCDGVCGDYNASLLNAVTSFSLGFEPQKRLCRDRGRDGITVVVFSERLQLLRSYILF